MTHGHRTSVGTVDDDTLAKILAAADKVDGRPVGPGSAAEALRRPVAGHSLTAKKKGMPRKLVEPGFRTLYDGVEFTLPLYLEPASNSGAIKKWLIGVAAKHRREWFKAFAAHADDVLFLHHALLAGKTLYVTITRLGRQMDDDGIQAAAKWLRDSVALGFGRGDSPKDPFVWHYSQQTRAFNGAVVRLSLT